MRSDASSILRIKRSWCPVLAGLLGRVAFWTTSVERSPRRITRGNIDPHNEMNVYFFSGPCMQECKPPHLELQLQLERCAFYRWRLVDLGSTERHSSFKEQIEANVNQSRADEKPCLSWYLVGTLNRPPLAFRTSGRRGSLIEKKFVNSGNF